MGALLKITSLSISAVLLVLGIACLVTYIGNKSVSCGNTGTEWVSLPIWTHGTGVAYVVIGACLLIITIIFCFCSRHDPIYWVFLVSASFTIVWTVVGYVSWLKYGSDCLTLNYPIWVVSIVTIIVSTVCIPISATLFIISFCCC